jgi:O-antigen ligase
MKSIQNVSLYLYCFLLGIENINIEISIFLVSVSKIGAILYLISVIKYKHFYALNKHFVTPLILIVIWLTMVSLFNINAYSSRIVDIEFMLNILLFILILNHTKRDPVVLEKGLLVFSLGVITVSILFFLGIGVEINQDLRYTWFGAGHNEIGSKLATALIIIMIKGCLKLGRSHLLLIAFMPLIFWFMLKTGSRTSVLILVASFSIWYFIKVCIDRRGLVSFAVVTFFTVVLIFLLLYVLMQSELSVSRFSETFDGENSIPLGGRLYLWYEFLLIIQDNFIFGHGLSGADLQTYNFRGAIESPHNVIIEVMLYTGVIGLILYIIFMYRIMSASYWVYKYSGNLLPVLLLPTILGFHLTAQGLTEKIVWVLIAYIVGSFLNMKSKSHENSNCN